MAPSDGETVWDLSAMDPDIRNISERVQSELFGLWEPRVSAAQQSSSESSESKWTATFRLAMY
jgi:hypothetical protein